MSDQQLALQSAEYLKNLKAISSLTGKTVDEMKAEQKAAQNNLAFRNKLATMDADQQKEVMAAMAAVPLVAAAVMAVVCTTTVPR